MHLSSVTVRPQDHLSARKKQVSNSCFSNVVGYPAKRGGRVDGRRGRGMAKGKGRGRWRVRGREHTIGEYGLISKYQYITFGLH